MLALLLHRLSSRLVRRAEFALVAPICREPMRLEPEGRLQPEKPPEGASRGKYVAGCLKAKCRHVKAAAESNVHALPASSQASLVTLTRAASAGLLPALLLMWGVTAVAAGAGSNDRVLLELERQYQEQFERDEAQFRARQQELQRRGDEELRRIDKLRAEIERCGQCARREALQAEHDSLVAKRQLGIDLACAALQAMGAMNRGLGNALPCRNVAADRSTERLRRLHAAAEGGGSEALFALGMAYRSRDRDDEACKYFRQLAQRDYDPGIIYLDGCLWQRHDPADPALMLAKLPACAARKVPECQFKLGHLLTTLDHPKIGRRQLALPVDETRALRLWEEAAAVSKQPLYAELVEALRRHVSRASVAMPTQPAPAKTPPTLSPPEGSSSPVSAFATRHYVAHGNDASGRAYRLTVTIDVQDDGSYIIYRGHQRSRGVLEGARLLVNGVTYERMADGTLAGRPPYSDKPEVWHPQTGSGLGPP